MPEKSEIEAGGAVQKAKPEDVAVDEIAQRAQAGRQLVVELLDEARAFPGVAHEPRLQHVVAAQAGAELFLGLGIAPAVVARDPVAEPGRILVVHEAADAAGRRRADEVLVVEPRLAAPGARAEQPQVPGIDAREAQHLAHEVVAPAQQVGVEARRAREHGLDLVDRLRVQHLIGVKVQLPAVGGLDLRDRPVALVAVVGKRPLHHGAAQLLEDRDGVVRRVRIDHVDVWAQLLRLRHGLPNDRGGIESQDDDDAVGFFHGIRRRPCDSGAR